ncbi:MULTISPECIES: hypothetical protein [unclassified Streptomyces]|uniref:hypothetical protein n=1 Tax=unclassified Streptomyces TaxID=2593676 RepID=UPI002E1315CB|nr:hypothetical protein OG452_19730 [Streptomyces sp. NBC_01197]WSS49927.1 hypothetical protein OG708_15525 [Streptomyces sp. NBC_01180]
MHKTLKTAAVVGASILAFSGVAAGVAQATPRQGADIKGNGNLQDCTNWGNALQKQGRIVGFACMLNQGGKTYELTPYYAN